MFTQKPSRLPSPIVLQGEAAAPPGASGRVKVMDAEPDAKPKRGQWGILRQPSERKRSLRYHRRLPTLSLWHSLWL